MRTGAGMRTRLRWAKAGVLASLLLALAPQDALAEKRVALVLGNAAYEQANALANPRNDAEAMAAVLARLGFDVVKGIDLDQAGMRRIMREFDDRLAGADVGLLYYAGHGLQVEGRNYLVPVDARLEREIDLALGATDVALVVQLLERSAPTSLVFLDACRDNPLARNLARSMAASRSAAIGRGLAMMESAVGSFIAYATQPDNVALDGSGANSPFTAALLHHIETPGLSVADLMIRVRNDVIAATDRKQVPWDHSSLTGGFYFVPRPAVATAAAPATDSGGAAPATGGSEVEIAFWNSVKDSDDPAQYAAYLETYPNGHFAAIARIRLERLQQGGGGASASVAAVAAQPQQPPSAPGGDDSASATDVALAGVRTALPADLPVEESVLRQVLSEPAFRDMPALSVSTGSWSGTFPNNPEFTTAGSARWQPLGPGLALVGAGVDGGAPAVGLTLQGKIEGVAALNGWFTLAYRHRTITRLGTVVSYSTMTSSTQEIRRVSGRLLPMAVGNELRIEHVYEETLDEDGDVETTRYVSDLRLAVVRRVNARAVGLPMSEEVFEVVENETRRDEDGEVTRQAAKAYYVPSLGALIPAEDGASAEPLHMRFRWSALR